MPRRVTVTFADGSSHVYENTPDDVTPQQIVDRATREFSKPVKKLDGGRGMLERGARAVADTVSGAVGAIDNAMQPLREAVGYDPEEQNRKTDELARQIRERQRADLAKQDGILDTAGDLFTRGMAGASAGIERVASGLALNDAERQRFVTRARDNEAIAKTGIAGETTWDAATSNLAKMPGFILEKGIESLPYMATAAVGPFGALANAGATTGQIAQSRAEADGRKDASGTDVAIAAPFGTVSTLIDSLSLGAMRNGIGGGLARGIVRDAATEGLTEAVQSGIEYTGGAVGTKQGFDLGEMGSQMLQGGLVGAGVGGGFGVVTEGTKATFDAAGRIKSRRADDTRTPGPGIREQAIADATILTPEDMASPLDNADIAAGRVEIAGATAGKAADSALTQAGLPKVGSKVNVSNLPGGNALTGTIEDVFSDDNGTGVVVRPEGGGKAMREYLDTLNELGVSITLSDPLAEADAIDAALAAQASAPMEASSPLPSAGAETPSPRPSGRTPSKAAGGGVNSAIVEGLRRRGFSEGQALGIAAGIHAESASNPNAKNPTSGAMGLGQWLGPRKDAIRKRFGDNPTLEQQLDFLADELRGGDAGGKYVLAQNDPAKVLDAYVRKFMRPAAGAETDGDIARGMAALGQAPTDTGPLVPESTTQFVDRQQQETPSVEVTAPAPDLPSGAASLEGAASELNSGDPIGFESGDGRLEVTKVGRDDFQVDRGTTVQIFPGATLSQIAEKEGWTRSSRSKAEAAQQQRDDGRKKFATKNTAGPQDGRVAPTVKAPEAGGPDATAASNVGSAAGVATPSARVEETGTGKSVAVIGATEAELAAIKAAIPKASPLPPRKSDGAIVYSKKYEKQIRDALQGVTETVTPAPIKEMRQGEVGMKLAAGEVVRTTGGRATTPFPKIALDTDRKAGNTLRNVDKWLVENALAEADARGDDFNAPMFRRMVENPRNLSQSDKDSAEEYLFGEQPPVLPPLGRPLDGVDARPAPQDTRPLSARDPRAYREQESKNLPDGYSLSDTSSGLVLKGPSGGMVGGYLAPSGATGETLEKAVASAKNAAKQDIERRAKMGAKQPDRSAAIIMDPAAGTVKTVPLGGQRREPAPAAPTLKPTDQATIDLLSRMAEAEDAGRRATIDSGTGRVKMMIEEGLVVENKGSSGPMWITSEKGRAALDAAQIPHAQSPTPSAPTPSVEPSKNRLVTDERAAELRERLKAKLNPNRLNSGIDPEIIAIGTELAVYHIENGARRFQAFAKAIAEDLGMKVQDLRLYMRGWYNGARDMMEDAGESVAGMDTPDEVAKSMRTLETWANEPAVTGSAEAATEGGDVGPAVYQDGTRPLAGAPAEPVSPVEGERDAGPRGATGEPGSSRAGSEADGRRDAAEGSGGDGPTRLNPAATGDGKRVGKKPKAESKPKTPAEQALTDPDEAIEKASPINVPGADFTITDEVELGQGTEGVKYQDNVAAIQTLKKIEAENRRASPAEQRVLARYVGWGGLKNAFRVAGANAGEGVAKGWEKRVAELEELLTPKELRAARNSTTAAHYTSQTVVEAMWRAVERMGFQGGSVLEPSVGTGNFIGLMPQALRSASNMLAVEYDSLTARIAQKLYPNATILHSGLQDIPLPSNQFALAIGNPPFGRESLFFPHNAAINGKSIHNQFFLASLDAVADGGLMGMVVSHNLMDALDPSARFDMARKAEFLGGIRLPDTAFKENARTEVVTDMLFFRKRSAEGIEAANAAITEIQTGKAPDDRIPGYLSTKAEIEAWTKSEKITDPAGSGETINANNYFMRNPAMVVGSINATGTMNARADLNVTLADPSQFKPLLDKAVERLPKLSPREDLAARTTKHFTVMADAMRLAARRAEVGAIDIDLDGKLKMVVDFDGGEAGKSLKREIVLTENTPFADDYTITVDGKWQKSVDKLGADGKPLKVVSGEKVTNRNQKEVVTYERESDIPVKDRWGKERIEALRAMIPIKRAMKQQFILESQGATDAMIAMNRKSLNKAYDAFVAKFGKLHDSKNARIAMVMPDGALALAAESNTGTAKSPKVVKADIMSRRVAMPPQIAESAQDAAEAVAISLSEIGRIDLDRVAKLLATDQAGAEKALSSGEEPAAFFDPEEGRWEARDLYLSGLVRRKLNMARAQGLEANVKALEAVMPEDWTMEQITPIIGSAWIPGDVYADFYKHLGFSDAKVSYSPVTNTFSVGVDGKSSAQWATSASTHSTEAIVMRLLNTQSMKVVRKDRDGKTYTDEEATAEAEQKAAELHNEFLSWAFADEGRAQRLVAIFNEKFNTRLIRQRDGSHLKLYGKVPDTVIKMRRHQLNGIWRGITDRAVLYDHVVGAGKTFTAIARIMERRRMGLSQKPMIVVPNHLVEQWAKDVKALYPGANVIAAGKADFERKNRRRLFARIASSDFDMVIIGHSSFGFIDLDRATEERYLMEELKAAQAGVKEAEEEAAQMGNSGWRKPMGVAEAERLVKKLEERLSRLRTAKRDRLLTFEEMGIDDLTVDEAHEFKNLAYNSRLSNVSGMGNKTGSQKAMDLHLKVRSLAERPGTSTAFLTGTPISNSVAEMYLILRNLAPNEMKEMGIENFDAWRSMFVSYGTAWEPTEAGGVKEVNRLGREWNNMRALMDLYYSVADAVTMQDIVKAFAEDNPGKKFPIPDVVSAKAGKGDREAVVVEPDAVTSQMLQEVVNDFRGLKGITDPKERNATRLRLMDRARKISLDPRAVDPRSEGPPEGGKIRAVTDRVAQVYKKWDADKGTQIIFLDRSVPKAKGDEKIVEAYDALRAKLADAIRSGDDKAEAKLLDDLEKYNPNEIESLRVAVEGGWNAYDEIKRQLVAKGIPENEIRYVQEAATDQQKLDLFALVKKGDVRVLIGSTPRMGAGTNVQDRLVALHHVDVTWKPSDIEQREGRIVRQGNKLLDKYGDDFAVEVIAYTTARTVDAKMWDLNASKLKAINGIRKYDGWFSMEFEDEESASMAEMAALATGDPLMIERVTLDTEIKKIELKQRSFNNRMNAMRSKLSQAKRAVAAAPARIAMYDGYAGEVEAALSGVRARSAERSLTVEGKSYSTREAAEEAAQAAIAKIRGEDTKARFSIEVGGEKVTTQDQIADAMRASFGTPDFEGKTGGQTITHINDLAKALSARAGEQGKKDTFTLDGISINGMPIELDVSPSSYARGGKSISLSGIDKQNRAVFSSDALSDGTSVSTMRSLIEKVVRNLDPERLRMAAEIEKRTADKAGSEISGLEAEVAKPFPEADALASKRARLQDVVGILAEKEKATGNAPQQSIPEESAIPAKPVDVREALQEQLANLRLADKVKVRVVDTLGGAAGEYQGGIVTIATDTTQDEAFTLNHEAVHALRGLGVFKNEEWAILSARARRETGLLRSIRQRYEAGFRQRGLSGAALDEAIIEEAVADLFARFQDGQYKAEGTVDRVFKMLRQFFEAVRNAFAGRGLRTSEGVMQDVASGEVGARSYQAILDGSEAQFSVPQRDVLIAQGGSDPTWRGKMAEAFDLWRTAVQDRYLPLLKVQRSIEQQTGSTLPVSRNPYMGEELMTGRIGARLEKLADEHVQPLFDAMHAEKVTTEELESYLYARHAPERNARIAEINPEFTEGEGSGMTDLEAAAIMSRIRKAGKMEAMERLAARVDALRDMALEYRVETGLLSKADAAEWKATYQHYIPLRGFKETGTDAIPDNINRSGGGINVRGRESKQAFGRRSQADSPLAYTILQAEEAIVRGETNLVAQRFVNLAKANPDPDFWKVNKSTPRRRMNEESGLVETYLTHNLLAEDKDWTVSAKFDGVERRVTMNRENKDARRLADAMRNLTQHQLDFVTLHLGKVNRFLSAVNTSFNPEFIVTNAFRDLQTAAFNLSGEGIKGIVKGTARDYRAALVASTKGAFGKASGEWGKWYEEFVMNGGRVYFNKVENVEEIKKRIASAAAMSAAKAGEGGARMQAKRVFLAARDMIENTNNGVENAVRLSVYKNAREAGLTPAQAASMAKNVTVNFNRRGTAGPALNAAYLFFNASVQGSARIVMALRSPKVRKMMAGVMIAAAAAEMLNAMMSADDDDGESIYDKIPGYEKSRNIIIMMPDGKGYVKIPMPYGYNAFWEAGRSAAEIARRGGARWKETMAQFVGTVADSFNPIGGSDSLLNLLAPTIADPIVDLAMNRDFTGKPIMPNQPAYAPEEPDNQRYFNSVGTHWRAITDFLNEATGGDEVVAGAVDVSPETLEYLAGTVVGSAGAFLDRIVNLAGKGFDETEEVTANDIPLARKVMGSKPSWVDKASYYDRIEQVDKGINNVEDYLDAGKADEARGYAMDNRSVLMLEGAAKQSKKDMREVRKARREIIAAKDRGTITDATYRERKAVVDKAERLVITEFNSQWVSAMQAGE